MNTSALEKMPAFPPVAARLLRVASDENAAIADLVYLLRSDPALSAEIIRYANSPLFSFAANIKTLDQAVPLLGVRKIRSLAIASIGRTYIRAVLVMDELRSYWRYSLACALLSEMLARFCAVAEDIAYSAGLLHDLGRLALMVTWPAEYAGVIQTANSRLAAGEDFDLPEYERTLFGLDRFAAGEWLARRWNLPDELCAIAGRFPQTDDTGDIRLTSVVGSACRLANSLGFGILHNPRGPSYREILDELPLSAGAAFPTDGEDLRLRIDEEIAALDGDPAEGERSPEMQTLLQMDTALAESRFGGDGIAAEPARSRAGLWQVALTAIFVIVAVLVWIHLTG
jgi:HD-like signal output (HDOD) protein